MLFPNATLLIFVISFFIFMFLLNEWFLKPVGEVIDKRKRMIASNLEAAKAARDEAKSSTDNYKLQLAKNREEAQAIITAAVTEAQATRNKELGGIKEQGRKRLDESRGQLQGEKKVLLESLVTEEAQLVKQIVGKVLGENPKFDVSEDSVKRALEEAI
jgi:F-type H+-transporting ATPase subunit b